MLHDFSLLGLRVALNASIYGSGVSAVALCCLSAPSYAQLTAGTRSFNHTRLQHLDFLAGLADGRRK